MSDTYRIVMIGPHVERDYVDHIFTGSDGYPRGMPCLGGSDPAEAGRPQYGCLPPVHRQRATIARPGTMFVNQPEIPIPLVVEFPFPAWATRPGEVAAGGVAIGSGDGAGDATDDDPFADL